MSKADKLIDEILEILENKNIVSIEARLLILDKIKEYKEK